jgi:acyl-coenzyme A thioesterase PaaI-like protein
MLYHHTRQHVIFADPKTAAFWYPNVQHGGPLAGLLVELVREKMPAVGMQLARLYMSLIRPVFAGELMWDMQLIKSGRNIQQVKVVLSQNQRLVLHGTLLFYKIKSGSPKGQLLQLPAWAETKGYSPKWPEGQSVHFAKDVAKIRLIKGQMISDYQEGAAWIDVGVHCLVDQIPISGDARVAIVADFSNALSSVISVDEGRFINADLSVEFIRQSDQLDLMLWSKTYSEGFGSGVVDGQIYDQAGLVAFCRQTILLDHGET